MKKQHVNLTLDKKEVSKFKKIIKIQNKTSLQIMNLSKFTNQKLIDYNNFHSYILVNGGKSFFKP